MAPTPLEDLARFALDGDRDAMERLVRELQGDVHGLALRMLWNREDAEDAKQEILVRTVTRLSQFDFHSTLKTWVYRIAVNYILDVKKSPVSNHVVSRFPCPFVSDSAGEESPDRWAQCEERPVIQPARRPR